MNRLLTATNAGADFSADIHALAQLVASPVDVHDVLQRALHALSRVVPYDLAAVFRLSGSEGRLVAAAGPLAASKLRDHRIDLVRFPTIRRALAARRPIALEEAHHASVEGDPYDGVVDLPNGHSCMVVPLFAGQQDLGLITVDRERCGRYPQSVLDTAGVYGQLISLTLHLADMNEASRQRGHQLDAHDRRRIEESAGAARAIAALLASREEGMLEVISQARQVADSHLPVLILGETGVGKEVLAQAIHAWSPRSARPFLKLNCSAIPENLAESELFGHTKGAFSGADRARPGRFVTANGGTLLLDEIGDMPLAAQAKLLRVLQEGSFEPVGSDTTVKVDVRVLAATHKDLKACVANGTFRQDLYYRLAVFPLLVPSLRDRGRDAVFIAEAFLARTHEENRRGPWSLSDASQLALAKAKWPGNVRELHNVLERAVLQVPRGVIEPRHLALGPAPVSPLQVPLVSIPKTFIEHERQYLEQLLASCFGRIYGPAGAAKLAGLKPTTLRSKLLKHGLR